MQLMTRCEMQNYSAILIEKQQYNSIVIRWNWKIRISYMWWNITFSLRKNDRTSQKYIFSSLRSLWKQAKTIEDEGKKTRWSFANLKTCRTTGQENTESEIKKQVKQKTEE